MYYRVQYICIVSGYSCTDRVQYICIVSGYRGRSIRILVVRYSCTVVIEEPSRETRESESQNESENPGIWKYGIQKLRETEDVDVDYFIETAIRECSTETVV